MSGLTEDEIFTESMMQAHLVEFSKVVMHAAETFERLAQIIKDLPNWRTERAVRRVARRGALLDCRKRARHASEMKRRRKTIAKWWRASLCSGLLATRSVVIPTRLKGFPDSDGWVQVIDGL